MSKNIRRICCVLRKKTMHPSDTKKGEQTNRGKDLDTKMVRGYGGGGGGAEDNGASGVGGRLLSGREWSSHATIKPEVEEDHILVA